MLRRPSTWQPPLGAPKLSARERALACWRGQDVRPLEKTYEASARPVNELLPKVLGQLRMDRRRGEAEIVRVWNSLIDPVLAAHAQPTGLHKGTLFVTVDHSAWLDEIVRYRRKEILGRLQHSFGREMVMRISFRLG